MLSLVMKEITFRILPLILPVMAGSFNHLEASIIFLENFETDGEGVR